MPKNIYSIKENLAKVEEVREIENETPSFEEFMETYEFDERIVSSYEDEINHVNVWTSKGVGPCSWNNPTCECYLGERFIPLYFLCPAPKYQNPCYCSDTMPASWFHVRGYLATTSRDVICGNLMISSEGRIKCVSCQVENSWEEWKFACASHPGRYEYASKSEFGNALTVLNNLWKDRGYFGRVLVGKMVGRLMDIGEFRYS